MSKSKKILLPKITDPRGNLTFIEGISHIPFKIERVFWVYDVPGGEVRGGHAYKTTKEFIVALSGSFDVVLNDGKRKKTHLLNRSYNGLYVPPGNWRHLENFSTNSLALVLSSANYDENDYIRNFDDFLNYEFDLVQKTISTINPQKRFSVYNPKLTSIENCNQVELDINHRDKGNITVVENNKTLPFNIQRVYYLYDVPGGEERGGHAHKKLQQLLIAANGSFDVILDDSNSKKRVHLNRSYNCLQIVPGIWRELVNFSSGSICLVLASEVYDEDDYIRDYDEFIQYKK